MYADTSFHLPKSCAKGLISDRQPLPQRLVWTLSAKGILSHNPNPGLAALFRLGLTYVLGIPTLPLMMAAIRLQTFNRTVAFLAP